MRTHGPHFQGRPGLFNGMPEHSGTARRSQAGRIQPDAGHQGSAGARRAAIASGEQIETGFVRFGRNFENSGSTLSSDPARCKRSQARLRQINAPDYLAASHRKMDKLIFRCTRTGMNVQIEKPEMAPTDHADSYESVTCPACTRIHLINKATGRMLGDNEK